jgi:alpha-methylacyl-CoA racemase
VSATASGGPLSSLRIVEIAGLGPGPFCGMMLADLGADVVRIERPAKWTGTVEIDPRLVTTRNRRSVGVDLKHPGGVETVLRLVERADAVFEGFRPGVAERLGFGPQVCLERNPRVVYGRMTGWGQDGPLVHTAGHDINYIALAGALSTIGEKHGRPIPPGNMLGDFGGGGMLLAFGLLAAVLEARESGQGQVVDAAMVDGAALLTTQSHEMMARDAWVDARGSNLVDTGAHFYNTYATADGEYVAVGAVEPQFYAELLEALEVPDAAELAAAQRDKNNWPVTEQRLSAIFRTRTRDQWVELFEGSDACVTPVLSLREATQHSHNRARGTFVEVGGVVQPAPAPRFSRTPAPTPRPCPEFGEHTRTALAEWGIPTDDIEELLRAGALS